VTVAAYVTTQARLKLYDNLRDLGPSVLYCDSVSVFFIQIVNETPNVVTVDCLGHLTVELEKFGSDSRLLWVVLKTMLCLFSASRQENVQRNAL